MNDSALSLWELMVELVYRLAQFVLGLSIPAEVFFSYTSESVERCVVTAEKDANTFTAK